MNNNQLIKSTLTIKLSTQSSAGECLNRDKNYKSSFKYTIPVINFRDESIEYACYSVNHAVIPVSFYNINESNNILNLAIFVNDEQGFFNASYAFEYGNYNASTFMSKFKSVLGTNWNITLDPISNCFTISTSLPPFQVLASSTISSVLGFSETIQSQINPSTISLFTNVVEFPRVCNFLPTPRIHLRCSNLANSLMVNKEANHSDILCSIPNDSKMNGQISFHNYSQSTTLIDTPFLQTFIINITDENGNYINFNGISSYFELSIDIYRNRPNEKPPTFRQLIRQLSQIMD
jgi:hypothetical protein